MARAKTAHHPLLKEQMPASNVALRTLIVEDDEDDAQLLLRALTLAGFVPTSVRVQTEADFRDALKQPWDLVLSDGGLVAFTALEALNILHEGNLDTPFIGVASKVDEDLAVKLLKEGADDCIVKGNWERLGEAVKRALAVAEGRRRNKTLAEALRIERERLKIIVTNLPMVLMAIDKEGALILSDGQGLARLDLEPGQHVGEKIEKALARHGDIIDHIKTVLADIPLHMPVIVEYDEMVFDTYYSPVRSGDGSVEGVTLVMIDSTARRLAEAANERLALHDSLTELPNRAYLNAQLEQEITRSMRYAKDPQPGNRGSFSLFIMDLNRFKEVNDTLGHAAGDSLLKQVGARLKAHVRDNDVIARLGGDEFAVLLPAADAEGAKRVATTLITELANTPFEVEGNTLYASTAIGIAVFPDHGTDASTLKRRADIAMYVAKRNGTNYATYSTGQEASVTLDQMHLQTEFKEAIAKGEMVLHYQPKVELATGQVREVEALVRWERPGHGLVPPDQFLAMAERTGLIHELTDWILTEALSQMRIWQDEGSPLGVAVNLSMKSLLDLDTPGRVAKLIEQAGVDVHSLTVEITESALMADPSKALEVVTALHNMGILISVDDFGTSYASLTYLRQFPVAQVKIDRSFVLDMATDEKDLVIVNSVIHLAMGLGIKAVAEGVEDVYAWKLLRKLKCHVAQGYFLARPQPASNVRETIREIERRLRALPASE